MYPLIADKTQLVSTSYYVQGLYKSKNNYCGNLMLLHNSQPHRLAPPHFNPRLSAVPHPSRPKLETIIVVNC